MDRRTKKVAVRARVNVVLDRELIAWLDRKRAPLGQSRSAFLRSLAAQMKAGKLIAK